MPAKRSTKKATAAKHLYDDDRDKEREKRILSGFLMRIGLRISHLEEGERPDFMVTVGARGGMKVAIEVTELHSDAKQHGSPKRRLLEQWRRIARRLRNDLLRQPSPLPSVYGSVFFSQPDDSVLDNLDAVQFVDEILLVLKETQIPTDGKEIREFDAHRTPLLSAKLERLFVRMFPQERGFLWSCSHLQAGAVLKCAQAIRDAVSTKRNKASGYRWHGIMERWLLIYASGDGLADLAVNLSDPQIGRAEPFSSIFVWDKFSETVYSLAPRFETVFENGKKLYLQRLPVTIQRCVDEVPP